MNVVPPIPVTDSVLLSSTLPELVPALYSPVGTYAMNARVAVALTLGKYAVYESQQPNNYARATTDTFWWKFVGYVYEAYSVGTTFPLNHTVTDTTNHLLYKSAAASNLGNALTDNTKWILAGATNRQAMFDALRDTPALGQGTMTVVLAPGQRVNTLALLKLKNVTRVVVTMTNAGATIYQQTIDLALRSVSSWLSWLYGGFSSKKNIVLQDLPPVTAGVITITMTGTGEISCGTCAVGKGVYIGKVEYGATSDVSNYSTVTRNFDGSVNTMTPRRNAPKNINSLWIPKPILPDVYDLRESYGGVPVLWIGIDQVDDEYFVPLLIFGFFTNFPIDLAYTNDAKASLTIEEF